MQKHYQLIEYCTLESCEDQMSACVRVRPRADQTVYYQTDPVAHSPGSVVENPYYIIDKNNWVAKIKLVKVPDNQDFTINRADNKVINKLKSYCQSFEPPISWQDCVFTAAKVSSDVVITADCQLYGRMPGMNLADKFQIPYFPKERRHDEHYLVAYDEPAILADLYDDASAPMKLTDYFFPGVMVHRGFWLQPAETYPENPEKITFHIEYDALTELFEGYAKTIGPDYVSKGTSRHIYAVFEVDLSKKLVLPWAKDELSSYPQKAAD